MSHIPLRRAYVAPESWEEVSGCKPGQSLLQCQFDESNKQNLKKVGETITTPTGETKHGVTQLSNTDKDCASNSLLGFITEPLCVFGKGITKWSGGFPNLNDWRIWLVVAVVVILILIAIIKGR